jgi:hypothetical protein
MEYTLYQFFKTPRVIVGILAWMLSSSIDASEVNSIVAISADDEATSFLLSDVQRIDVLANETDGTMTVVTKDGYSQGEYQKIIFASETTSVGDVEVPNVYVYPNPVLNTIHVTGVDEEETDLIVFDLTGKCLLCEKGDELDVTSLSKGTYILFVDNLSVKFIKK